MPAQFPCISRRKKAMSIYVTSLLSRCVYRYATSDNFYGTLFVSLHCLAITRKRSTFTYTIIFVAFSLVPKPKIILNPKVLPFRCRLSSFKLVFCYFIGRKINLRSRILNNIGSGSTLFSRKNFCGFSINKFDRYRLTISFSFERLEENCLICRSYFLKEITS